MIPKLSGATHAMLNNLKLFTRVASLSLILTPVKAWSEWRVPERVEIVLGTETLASERQAVLVLSAVVGSNLCSPLRRCRRRRSFGHQTSAGFTWQGPWYPV